MSGKKWPRVWANPNRPIACWPAESKTLGHAEFMQVEEHQAILSEEQRLNAMGQERELALMARVKELEKKLVATKDIIAQCLHARQCNAPYGQREKMPTVDALKQVLAAIGDNKQPRIAGKEGE